MNSLTDEPRSGEKKEEVQQQEIDISTTSCQVSTEPIHDASISAGTQPHDEKQPEARPS
jgi:hypothetical protein